MTGAFVPDPALPLAERLSRFLWPERYPPGHRLHDPSHPFWDDDPQPGDEWEWEGADMLDDLAFAVYQELKRSGGDRGTIWKADA